MSSWHSDIARVHGVYPMNVEQLQAAADPQTKSTNFDCESACIGCYHLHSPLLLNSFGAE